MSDENGGVGLAIKIIGILVSVMATVAMALGVASFKFAWDAHGMHSELDVRLATIDEKLALLAADKDVDVRQDTVLSKHWSIHSDTKSAIQRLYIEHGLGVWDWDRSKWTD